MTTLQTLIHIVAIKKHTTEATVETAWKAMIDRLKFTIGCGSQVIIPGFGIFFVENNLAFFTRITHRDSSMFPHKNFKVCNKVYDERCPLIFNAFMISADKNYSEFVNSVRLRHFDTDPLEVAVLIEMNRMLIFKRRNIYIEGFGYFQTPCDPNAPWYDLCYFDVESIQAHVQERSSVINAWISRLVMILRSMI